jgi:hypothetical protein
MMKTNQHTQKTIALLKILALGMRQVENTQVQPASDVFKKIRASKKER